MLIDWLTLKICSSKIEPDVLSVLRGDANTILCISPDGEHLWETPSRVSIRSDTHKLSISVGGFIVISGSPARFMPDDFGIYDNVFGSLDIVYCANLMLKHIENTMGVKLPYYKKWNLTRIDITQNYFLSGGSADVERVLSHWRHVEMGKYKTTTFDDSVYVQVKNRINSGKAYWKGKQLVKDYRSRFPTVYENITKDLAYDEYAYEAALDFIRDNPNLTDFEKTRDTKLVHDIYVKGVEMAKRLRLAMSLLRLEAIFGSRYWNEKNKKTGVYLYRLKSWYKYTPDDIITMFDNYFETRFGRGVAVEKIDNLLDSFIDSAIELGYSKSTGRSAFQTFNNIKTFGKFNVYSKNNSSSLLAKSTYYKHKKIALNAGLTFADFETGAILPLQRSTINLQAVNSWSELYSLAS
jgi:uncharacterized protein YggL (DUF469 family)